RISSSRGTAGRCTTGCATSLPTGASPPPLPGAASKRSVPATPATIVSMNCSPSSAGSARRNPPTGATQEGQRNEDRLLWLEPAFGLLERRGHLLPRHAAGAARKGLRRHLLRTG